MKLYFVRHGESQANVLRVISNRGMVHGLTERGKQQAAALATELIGAQVWRIYSSPLLRAVQTAEILSQAIRSPLEITDALREFDCGIAEGRSDEAAWAMHQQVFREWFENKNWDARIEQGESFIDMRNKFVPFIERVIRENSNDDNLVFVMHGAIIVCMLPLILRNIDSQFAMSHSGGQTNALYSRRNDIARIDVSKLV
jgi:broad specificity phosphatase PhoE